jgi:hypothetical protein
MFYVEEDIAPVVDIITRRLGPAGTMTHGKNVLMNVTLSTREFGAVWYGDFEGTLAQLTSIVNELSVETGYNMHIIQ